MKPERWSGQRRLGYWAYVVKAPGIALEVLVYRPREPCRSGYPLGAGRLRVQAACIHRRVAFELVPALIGDLEPCCELVGGACELDGSVTLAVDDLLEEHGQTNAPDFEQSEAFWQGLEAVFDRALR